MQTAEDGSYQVQGLALGFYRIEVVESLPGYYSHGFLNVDANHEGYYVYNANLYIDPLGIVFDEATGEPIQWAVVSLFDLSSDEIVQLPPYTWSGTAESSTEQPARILRLLCAARRIQTSGDGYRLRGFCQRAHCCIR